MTTHMALDDEDPRYLIVEKMEFGIEKTSETAALLVISRMIGEIR